MMGLKAKKDKQPVPKGWKAPSKQGGKLAKQGTAKFQKGKYVS